MRPLQTLLPVLLFGALAGDIDAAEGKLYRWTDADGVVHYTDSPPPDRQFETRPIATDPDDPPADAGIDSAAGADLPAEPPATPSLCEQARRNLAVFETSDNVSMDLDGDGSVEPLDADAREQQLAETRALVARHCRDDG